jgi:hypothetical protein
MSRITRFILTLAVITIVSFVEVFAAVAPSSQSRFISFSDITSNSVKLTVVKGNGNKRVVVFSTDGTVDTPINSDTALSDPNGSYNILNIVKTGSSDIIVDVLDGGAWFTNVTGLSAGVTYTVKVFEFNNDNSTPKNAYLTGNGTNNPRSFTTAAGPVEPPTLNAAANVSATTADLSWTDENSPSDGFIFTLWVDQDGEGSGGGTYEENSASVSPYIELDLGFTTAFDLTDLVGPSDYKYEVSAYIGNDESESAYGYFFTPEDITNPTVLSVALSGQTGNGGTIYEGDAGNNVTLTVTFSEAMKTWMTPSFAFSATSDLTYVTGSWDIDGQIFTAYFLVGDTDQEHDDVDVTITGVDDLAGNSVDDGIPNFDEDVFSIDNEDGVLSNFEYATAGTNDDQPTCKSGVNGDVVEFEIDLVEDGYNFANVDNSNFVVEAEGQNSSDIITFSSTGTGGTATYLFTTTLNGTPSEDVYDITITFTDEAGNEVVQTETSVFSIDNTAPVISNLQITGVDGTCLSEDDNDVLEYTFLIVEEGCDAANFDENNVTVTITGPAELPPDSQSQSLVLTSGTGTVGDPYLFTGSVTIDTDDADGDWNIVVDATDFAGNDAIQLDPAGAEYIVDNTAPTIYGLTVTSASCVNDGSDKITFTFTGYDNGCGLFEKNNVTVTSSSSATPVFVSEVGDGDILQPTVFTYSLDISDSDGDYTITVNASDDAGNSSTPLVGTDIFTVDNTKPIIQNTAYDLTCVNGTDVVTLTFEVVEEGCGTFDQNDISVDESPNLDESFGFISQTGLGTSGSPYVFTYSINIESLDPDGAVDVTINATDDAGNDADEVVNTGAFTIDNTAPVISNVAVDKTCVNGGTTVTLTFDVAEAGCGVFDNSLITISDNATTANNWTYSSGAPGAGTYTYTLLIAGGDADNTSVNVTVDADDAAGNSATPVTNTGAFAIDNTDPTVTIDDPIASAEVNSSKVIDFTVTETGCGTPVTEASVNGGTNWTAITNGVSTLGNIAEFGPLGDGAFTLSVRTTDGAGNVSSTATVNITKDATKPTVTFVSASDQEISIADNGNPFSIDIDFNEGMDQSTAPVVTITSNNTLPTTNTGGSWTDSDTYNATFGNIDVSTAEAIEDLDVVVSGAKDDTEDDGNEMLENNTSGLDNFSIDTEAPTISFDGTSPAADDCVRGIETVEFTAADASAFSGLDEVRAKINFDDDYEVVTSGFALEDLQAWDTLSQGTFTLYLLALDDFGNTTEITRDLNKDDVSPIITLLSVTPSCVTAGDDVTITFSVEEDGCGTFDSTNIELTIDDSGFGPEAIYTPTVNFTGGNGSNATPYTFSATFTILTSHIDGEYLVTVTATDDAGNSDSDDETFDVDQTPPTLSNLVTSSVPGGSPTKVGGSAPNRVLTIAFNEVTDGCANFDNGTITYIITGPGNTPLTVSPAAPTKSVDTWTTTVTIPANEPTGNYQIKIIAADNNGNADTLDPAGVEFVIDNTKPQVSNVTTSHTPAGQFPPAPVLNRADDDGGSPEFYIDVVYNEPLDPGQTIPTLEFHIAGKNPTTPVAALTLGTPSRPNSSTLRYPYNLDSNTNLDMRAIGVRINGASDAVGNIQTSPNTKGSLFGIDFETPQLVSVTPTPTYVVDGSSQLGLLFEFTENMITNVKPTVSFDAGNGPDNDSLALILTYNEPLSTWNSATLFTAKFDVDGSHPLDSDPIAVGLSGATDDAGNPFPGSNETGVFIVDTKEPTCVSLVTDPVNPIVNLGDLDFDVTIVMDQALDNGITPTITFATSSAFTVSGGAYTTTTYTNDTYTFTVTHNGTTEEEHQEIMTVTGFKDINGNVQIIACVDTFDVDTDRPDIVSLTVSDSKICGDDHGNNEVITITFDEVMDSGIAPVITFDTDIVTNGILTFSNGVWSNGDSVYTATYAINASSEFTINDVDVIVNTAEDLLGNVMLQSTTSDTIDVDTELPSVTGIAFNPVPSNAFGVNRSNIGPNGFQVVVTFDEAMDGLSTPTITFEDLSISGTGTVAAALTAGNGSWTSSTVFTKEYTVNDASVELDLVTADVSGAKDACGNTQNLFDGSVEEVDFAIDLIAPTCDGLYVEYSLINENRLLLQELFANFSEPMDETIDVAFNFAVSGNFTIQNDGDWNDPDEYIVSAYHNGNEEGRFTDTISLDLSGVLPKDLAGNPIESSTCTYEFDVDTKKPLVTGVTFTPSKVIGTTTTLSVEVEFNEDMENVVIPTLSFSTGSGAFALQQTSDWVDATHYIFDYVVTDIDIEATDVTVTINGAEDNAGNVMLPHESTETFNIDQVEPTVTSVTFSSHPGWINRTDIGNGNFTVTVVYDEAMDNTMAPTIDLDPFAQGNPVLSDALVFASGAWSTGSNTDDTYTATYNVIDVAFADEQLGATISSGKDACGNTQVTYNTDSEGDGVIDIDLVNPTVVFDGFTPLAESCVNGTESIDFTANDVNFFDQVQGRINGGTFATCTTGVQLNALNGWPGTDGSITLELKALDLAGNETTISRIFTADVTAPVISNVQFTNTCVTTGDVVTLTFDVVEDGCGTFDSDDISISEFENGFVADGSNPTGSGTYTFTLLIDGDDTEGLKLVTINATDEAGNDAIPSVNNNAFTIDKTEPNFTNFGLFNSSNCLNNSSNYSHLIASDDNTFGCGPYNASNITASTSLGSAIVNAFFISDWYEITVDLSGTDSTDDGTYDIEIVMTDAAGNVRNETITNAFTIDNTAPVISNVTVTPGCENGGGTVTLTFDVVENGCGTFNKDDITIVDDVATNFNWTWVSGTGSGTYTYTLLIDGTDPDGDVDVSVNATDDAGNSSTGNDIGDTDFTIDNTAPTVTFTDPTGGETVNDSKVIDYTATDGSGCGINVTEYRFNSTGSWTTAPVTGTTLSGYTGFSSLSDGAFTLNFRSTDVAGNIGTSNVSLTKDATGPDVTSVTPSDNLISIADNGTPFTIAVLFNEGMDTGTTPVVTLDANNTVVTTNTGGTWSSGNTIYTATFGTIDALTTPETITSLGVTVSNVKDDTEDIGNSMDFPAGFSSVFSIDTEAPTCFDITNNNADIYENDLSVTVSVQFTEAMATSPNPSFIITGTTELTPGASNWSGDTFTQTFTHSGVEEETSAKFEIDGFAALPTDLAGNPVSAVLCSTDVDIDTRKPLVTSVVFSTSLITESTTSLDVTVNFDEDMSTPPTIEFNTLLPGLLTYNGVSSTSTSFTYNYSVADANLDLDDITVDVAIGEDVAGNVMLTHTSTESFDIDQVAPVGTIDLALGQSDPANFGPINFALTFNEDVTGLEVSDIVLSGTAGATTKVLTGSGSTYNVAVSGMSTTGTVIINLASSTVIDAAGNNNTTTILTDNSVDYEITGFTTVEAGAVAEPATLSSLVDTQGEAVLNFDFDVTDDKDNNAVDTDATLITDISISQGTGNDFVDWTTIISGAILTDGTNTVSGTVGATTIAFTGLAHGAGQIGEVKDDSTKTYTLKVWLSDSPSVVIDNENLAFKVNRSSFTVDGGGSSFVSGAGTAVESGSSNNAINVVATKLLFTTTPVKTVINTNTTFVVEATDVNDNRDVDNSSTLTSFFANQSTITSGNTGSLSNGILTLNAVQFSTAFANDYVTATAVGLSNGVSSTFNIKEATPASITNLSIIPNSNSFKINFTNPDNKNTLIIAKKTSSTTLSYSNEAGMDDETSWAANTNYGSSATPSDASTFVIYAGSGATSVTMYNLINNFQRYTIAAYAYAGALNSGVQNFNENETTKSGLTMPKGSNYSENISKGMSLGIDNITPQPANLNNLVSLQVETIEDMPLTLELYDSKGQLMMTLFEGRDFSAGETQFEFNLANTVSSGQHFLRLTGNGHVVIAPLMIVK